MHTWMVESRWIIHADTKYNINVAVTAKKHYKFHTCKMLKEHSDASIWVKKASYTPLRLNNEERKTLEILEAALNVIEYTDHVDILTYSSRSRIIVKHLSEMCSILSGLVVAMDIKLGCKLFDDKDHFANADFFKRVFEIGRRYKIMNPGKMRTTYGAMMYMCQDSMLPEVRSQMKFDFYAPIRTVYTALKEIECLELLDDTQLPQALTQIPTDIKKEHRLELLGQRNQAVKELIAKFDNNDKDRAATIERCLASLADHEAFLVANRNPVEQMRDYLHQFFSPEDSSKTGSLKIGFMSGARLNHSHKTQFYYVDQSLLFWTRMMDQTFDLWLQSDADLLNNNGRYHISDTGQGLNRVQQCPHIQRLIHSILSASQNESSVSWIGSSVVHLGDRAVPNALMFIDKYRQVPHILTPLVQVMKQLESLKDPFLVQYIDDEYGGVHGLQKTLLLDFFKHGFDGRGADNYYDAGSCIDGRLTSAWNWTNEISKKKYYRVLLMSGFLNFEGI
ncbi:DUF2009 protein [Schizosaccharomyces japonicus yFS275]|uniref:DUF2009 protein n=1 Tax=Schizosaccharomyces japonicus (strain yFS275 / FY16936) TaxID=402676 RepID=B6K692_SCHJY|nr:DUF2009 protein [Schizosaccharomyces japonicus yFS275]EEB09046.2 DUF2009 protein [Schizosaccharomyces japonicus yFS275]